MAGVSLFAAMGQFVGPLWVARGIPALVPSIGPHDPMTTNAIRQDGFLRDGDGSFYSILAAAVPGFHQFRYPSKLLTFTILALAVLAGHGWDVVADGRRRGFATVAGTLFAISVVGMSATAIGEKSLTSLFEKAGHNSSLGPFDASGASGDLRNAFIHGAIGFGALIGISIVLKKNPRVAGLVLIGVVAIDLGLASRRLIFTADQAEFDKKPRAVEIIAEAEKASPSAGPYRVHRMAVWSPIDWYTRASNDRIGDFVRWERDSIQPKYGINHGVEYTHTQGVAELYDYEWFFGPWTTRMSPELAQAVRVDPKERLVYYPRRGFDLWNTRYFVLPGLTRWTDGDRGVISLVNDAERIYPRPDAFKGEGSREREEAWLRTEDMQILRNKNAYPRAWVVHDARFSPPIDGLSREARARPMEEMLYAADPFWNETTRISYDPRLAAWFEVADRTPLARFMTRGPAGPGEAVTVRPISPREVELHVTLDRPGFVILADVYYPGWTLTIDGTPAPILRANRMMRGAMVEAGKHTLIYEYRPRSFLIGIVASLLGLVGLVGDGGLGDVDVGSRSVGVAAGLRKPGRWRVDPPTPTLPHKGGGRKIC